ITLCGLITFSLSLFSIKYRKTTGAFAFFGLMISITLYAWGYAFELNATHLDSILLTVRMQYLALAVLPVFWLILAITYTGKGKWLTWPFFVAIMIIPIITVISINTNDYHHLFYTTTGTKEMGPFVLFTRTLGVAFWIQFGYLNLCTFVGNILFFYMLLHSAPAYKKQAATMFIGSLFPWVINFLSHSITLNPYQIDYNVYALAVTSPFFAVAMFKTHMLDLAPVAHDRVFDSMTESVLVVDNHGRIADINHAACTMLGISLSVVGQNLQDGLSHWPDLIGIFEKNECGAFEVNIAASDEDKWLITNLSPLLDKNNHSIGQILIMNDISDKKSLEIKIFENEKRLKNDVMKIRNLQGLMMPDFSAISGFDIDSIFYPVDELSGDFFDGFFLEEDIYQIIICDVVGHGILPAFIGMEIRSMFRAISKPGIMPSELISKVNIKMFDDSREMSMLATAMVCQINITTGQITTASGGHPHSFLYRAVEKKADIVKTSGSILGMLTLKPYSDIVIEMKTNDILLLYTDGISEAMHPETKEFYGTVQMQKDLVKYSENLPKEIAHSITKNALEFSETNKVTDDMTIVCIKKIQT
ncbi:MAG: SpoIIE family protein phosphatase, partial [Spirochaetaceae bacterium]|nr:SpoIIE family protein phosphatase [Spirochaetaceae bacterium]